MAQEPIHAEFVRHFRYLSERTGNNPSGVVQALDKNPDLASRVERLHEIQEGVDQDRKFSSTRILVQRHPDFRKALIEFSGRWSRAWVYAQDWLKAKDFVRHYRALLEQTGNRPDKVRETLDQNPDLGNSIRILHRIRIMASEDLLRFSVFQPQPEFLEALNEFEARWPHAYDEYRSWEEARWLSLRLIIDDDDDDTNPIEEPLPETQRFEGPLPETRRWENNDESEQHFDPMRDKVANIIQTAEDDFFNNAKSEDEFGRWNTVCSEGLAWLQDPVGLDFDEIQTRWVEVPLIIVPKHIEDDERTAQQKYGLFKLLEEIRRAYIIGADFGGYRFMSGGYRASYAILYQQ